MNFTAFVNPLWNFSREYNDFLLILTPSAGFSLLKTLAKVLSIATHIQKSVLVEPPEINFPFGDLWGFIADKECPYRSLSLNRKNLQTQGPP